MNHKFAGLKKKVIKMKMQYVWKVLSEDGLLKDPPIFTDCYHYEFDVNGKNLK